MHRITTVRYADARTCPRPGNFAPAEPATLYALGGIGIGL